MHTQLPGLILVSSELCMAKPCGRQLLEPSWSRRAPPTVPYFSAQRIWFYRKLMSLNQHLEIQVGASLVILTRCHFSKGEAQPPLRGALSRLIALHQVIYQASRSLLLPPSAGPVMLLLVFHCLDVCGLEKGIKASHAPVPCLCDRPPKMTQTPLPCPPNTCAAGWEGFFESIFKCS